MQPADTQKNTRQGDALFGEIGTVRVVFENREYVFAPNQSITFADDQTGIRVAALDGRLRVTDDRDGNPVRLSSPSVVVTRW